MRILYSKTGSRGNCSVLQSEDGHLLVIDCGLKYDNVNRAVDYSLHQCKTLLVSHDHSDHCLYAKTYQHYGMRLYSPSELLSKEFISARRGMVALKHKQQFEVDGFKIVPIEMEHCDSDGKKCECYGFLIQDTSSLERLLFVTDTQYIPYKFPPLDLYAIEANYWEQEEYMDDIDSIEKVVEMRRVRSHMSVQSAAKFLKMQDLSKCKEIRLLHLSNSMTDEERERIIPYIKEQIGRDDINVII